MKKKGKREQEKRNNSKWKRKRIYEQTRGNFGKEKEKEMKKGKEND